MQKGEKNITIYILSDTVARDIEMEVENSMKIP